MRLNLKFLKVKSELIDEKKRQKKRQNIGSPIQIQSTKLNTPKSLYDFS